MSSGSSTVCLLALTLWALPTHAAHRVFESWDDFYRGYIQSTAQEVSTDLPPNWRDGEQVSRDFEIGNHTLRLLNPPARTLRLNGKTIRVAVDWPRIVKEPLDLASASAFTYPETELLACVQANFQGIGQSGSFQNVRQLNLIFRFGKEQGGMRGVRVTGYGFDCQGVYKEAEGWQLAQVVEGRFANEKLLKRWRLGAKGLTPVDGTTSLRMEDGKIQIFQSERLNP